MLVSRNGLTKNSIKIHQWKLLNIYLSQESIFTTCVWNVLLHENKAEPLSKDYLYQVIRSDHAMNIGFKLSQQHPTDDFRQKVRIQHLEEIIRGSTCIVRRFPAAQRQN